VLWCHRTTDGRERYSRRDSAVIREPFENFGRKEESKATVMVVEKALSSVSELVVDI
jgi:hypothetical protein